MENRIREPKEYDAPKVDRTAWGIKPMTQDKAITGEILKDQDDHSTTRHPRGSSPPNGAEQIYRAWLQRLRPFPENPIAPLAPASAVDESTGGINTRSGTDGQDTPPQP